MADIEGGAFKGKCEYGVNGGSCNAKACRALFLQRFTELVELGVAKVKYVPNPNVLVAGPPLEFKSDMTDEEKAKNNLLAAQQDCFLAKAEPLRAHYQSKVAAFSLPDVAELAETLPEDYFDGVDDF